MVVLIGNINLLLLYEKHLSKKYWSIKQINRAEHLAERADKKAIIFDTLVDLAEKEYNIDIRKNYTPELWTPTENKIKEH